MNARWMFITMWIVNLLDSCLGLNCWFCTGEQCETTPRENHLFKIRTCLEGQSCQKVVYMGLDFLSNHYYHSVVRSCSQENCTSQHDNCTDTLVSNPGCADRFCCHNDLCNAAVRINTCYSATALIVFMILLAFIT